MIYRIAALCAGFLLDMILGDPRYPFHPVVLMGKLISALEKGFRALFPKTPGGERASGACLWLCVVTVSAGAPWLILHFAGLVSPYLRLALESVFIWQSVALCDLRRESMRVYKALKDDDLEGARRYVSMIVGRDTEKLGKEGVARAAVETVAENLSDGVIAPMLYAALFGAPGAFFYKAVNTMDSMLGYIDPPYTHIGLVPARADDLFNLLPSRIAAHFMMIAGLFIPRLSFKGGMRIFSKDRYKHKSPNSAMTESVCAGLFGVRLAGDAYYRGVLHKKPYIGDDIRPIEINDIKRANAASYVTAILFLVFLCAGLYFLK